MIGHYGRGGFSYFLSVIVIPICYFTLYCPSQIHPGSSGLSCILVLSVEPSESSTRATHWSDSEVEYKSKIMIAHQSKTHSMSFLLASVSRLGMGGVGD